MGKKKSFKITPKHRRFVRYFIVTGNITESAKLAGFSVKYGGKELINNPVITRLIEEARYKAGLTDELLERKHVELLNCGDRSVELGATRLGYQVKKKIGSDEAPPPAVLPAVIVRIEAARNDTSNHGATSKSGRGHTPDAPPRVSIRVTDKP